MKTFGILFGKKVGDFARRAEEIVSGELTAAPEIKAIVETMMEARRSIIELIRVLDRARPRSREAECHGPDAHDRTRRWVTMSLARESGCLSPCGGGPNGPRARPISQPPPGYMGAFFR